MIGTKESCSSKDNLAKLKIFVKKDKLEYDEEKKINPNEFENYPNKYTKKSEYNHNILETQKGDEMPNKKIREKKVKLK